MCLYVRILSCVLFLNSASWANSSGQSASLFSLDTIREQSLQGVVLDGHFSVARFQQIKGDRAVDLFQQQYLPVFEDIWGSAQYSDIGLKVHRSIYGGYPGTSTEVLVADKAGEFVD
ncbi:MAG: hypothetical protein B7X06_03395 [Verrucomicrobia bacterium 21-51-4]|nr:MAG: hypothetical protein B7X06_03395 [Verrucomicrobia bacterium 21-51-4]